MHPETDRLPIRPWADDETGTGIPTPGVTATPTKRIGMPGRRIVAECRR